MNTQLKNNRFIAGNEFTLPDAYLFVMIRWLVYFKFDFKNWPHISRYFEELQKRQSIKMSLDEESK